jgi:hypothetical protein
VTSNTLVHFNTFSPSYMAATRLLISLLVISYHSLVTTSCSSLRFLFSRH